MDFLSVIFDFILHLDRHLNEIIQNYDSWTYAILFAIIFLETGVVLAPFLPGDSLIFAAGTFSALGSLNPYILATILTLAATLGDAVNYWIGYHSSSRLFKEESKWLNKKHLERTEKFYEVHGKKTIIIARFLPIIRTFAPFVAGIGKMNYRQFTLYNVLGGVFWVNLFVFTGYFFGATPIVRENFTLVIAAVIVISTLPALIEMLRHGRKKKIQDVAKLGK